MQAFFGVVLNLGTIYLADIKDYFSKDFTCNIPFLQRFLKKNVFFKFFGCSIYIKIRVIVKTQQLKSQS
ncbi:hypothetical protein H312_02454 [Anncaliia algerae PRA339]|uniref:Uncharacterized protein n=1 Tax=Anncaliia algerae PRA339 TaxID=1288291 RepID=A0A059EZ74_9MICR|nr:hypothetical protein H312_02454 [Anncaliia algerae PRA339]